MSEEDLMPFSSQSAKQLRFVVNWLANIDKEHGLGVEALDAFLGEYVTSQNLDKAVWHATCEWDL